MNLTSFLANKCFAFLLSSSFDRQERQGGGPTLSESGPPAPPQISFPLPWVPNSQTFRANCDACGKCLASCENNILVRAIDGYPQVDFSIGPCSFCGACVESCPRDVFGREKSVSPWAIKACINADCLSHNNVLCRICAEYCEYDAIVFSKGPGTINTPRVVTDSCKGCGACFGPCPVRAIEMSEKARETISQEESR